MKDTRTYSNDPVVIPPLPYKEILENLSNAEERIACLKRLIVQLGKVIDEHIKNDDDIYSSRAGIGGQSTTISGVEDEVKRYLEASVKLGDNWSTVFTHAVHLQADRLVKPRKSKDRPKRKEPTQFESNADTLVLQYKRNQRDPIIWPMSTADMRTLYEWSRFKNDLGDRIRRILGKKLQEKLYKWKEENVG